MTNQKTVEEIVDGFNSTFTGCDQCQYGNGQGDWIKHWLTQTLQAERQKREEMVEAERLISTELYQALKMMYTQYCPEPSTHQFMTAGENAEEKLDCYSYLNCDCEDAPEQKEENGHTRYCEALTHPTNPN